MNYAQYPELLGGLGLKNSPGSANNDKDTLEFEDFALLSPPKNPLNFRCKSAKINFPHQ